MKDLKIWIIETIEYLSGTNFMNSKITNIKQNIHIAFIELETEEESVYTLYRLSILSNYKISLFISRRIWSLIKGRIDEARLASLKIYSNKSFIDILDDLESMHLKQPIDLFVFPRFQLKYKEELSLYKKFFLEHNHLVAIFNYDRWFSKLPPIIFNGWKIIRRGAIMDWYYCHTILPYVKNVFISEIHTNSTNPLKKYVSKYLPIENISDIPFKLPLHEYNPNYDYDSPVFIIPGGIERSRRNYYDVLNIFNNENLWGSYKWELILLGEPKGDYGERVISYAKELNKKYGFERIKYFNDYVSYFVYKEMMDKATHILSPLNHKNYKHGKDSGAIYDIFTYNKIGIINREYFYDDKLPELDVIHTFSSKNDLLSILDSIIKKSFDYKVFFKKLDVINREFNIDNYQSGYSKFVQRITQTFKSRNY